MTFTALVVVSTGAIYLTVLYREVHESASAAQRSEARGAAVPIEQFLSGIRGVLGEASALPWNAGVLSPKDRREEYHRLLKILPSVSEIRWIDNQGLDRLKVSRFEMDTEDSLAHVMGPAAIAEARQKGFVYGKPYFRDGSEPFVTLVIASPHDSAGLLRAEIDLKFVTDVVRRIRLGSGGSVYVAGTDSRLIAHPNLNLVLGGTDLSDYQPLRDLRSALPSGEDSPAGMFAGPGLEAGEVLLSGVLIPSVGWIVVAEQRKEVVLAPVYGALLKTAFLVLASLGAALLVSYWLARRLANPILELRHGVEKVAGGDLNARIQVDGDDEVQTLANEFNNMAAQLQGYTVGLERKVQEKTADLQSALDLAEEAMRARAIFLAAASHDLRQPLYAISILADTLAMESLHDNATNILEKQRQAIKVLQTLFDNLLDLSRFDAGEIRPALRVVSLRDVLAPLVLEHEVMCDAKGLRLECDIEQAWVRTDPELIRRVVGNLLSNAVRYTRVGGVVLKAQLQGEKARITITDSGIGIAAADQERIFQEFVQVANPSRDRDKGVGLGLSIVKRIALLLGLDLALRSAPSRGTTVTFDIAVATGVEGSDMQGELAYAAAGAFKGIRIWIVEDDALIREALALQFNAWEALPAFAGSITEVMSLRDVDDRWPDAVIVDDMLGADESGLQVALVLREYLPACRILLVTGNVDPDRTQELEGSGFVVLRKPLASSDLALWLREALLEEATESPAR